MPQFSNKRRVRHSARKMFDLVADVERYPEFVPMCQALKVRQRTQKPDGTEVIVADMTVSFQVVRETFTSRVTLDRPKSENSGRVPARPVQQTGKPLDLRGENRERMRCGFLYRLRIQESDARGVDGRDVRRRFSALRRGVRETRGCGLWAAARGRFLSGGCGPRAISISIFNASITDCSRTLLRPTAPKRHSLCAIRPSRAATARCTNPTGFPGVAPPGPAMPVIETARSTSACSSAPNAIAVAVSLLTAPNVSSVEVLTPSIACLAALE